MSNYSSLHPNYFYLIGIPGLEASHLLISIPFFVMYLLSLIGNLILIAVISANEALHQPMYMFLAMLAACDIILGASTVPKTLSLFWFDSHVISYSGCLTQVFFIHFAFITEAAILVSMGYDRYYAICHPLTYAVGLSPSVVIRMAVFAVFRSLCLVLPFVFLLMRLPYQQSNVIQHTYCEHMSVARVASANIRVNILYGLVVAFVVGPIDLGLIAASYSIIITAVLRLPSSRARVKAFNTCVSHVSVIILFYVPAYVSFITHRVGHKYISLKFHIIFANLYVLVPPLLNPVIYGIRTSEIRQKVVDIFSRSRLLQDLSHVLRTKS
ncbi:olfactory receptor 52D1-like [Gastrophryne carolinensis]